MGNAVRGETGPFSLNSLLTRYEPLSLPGSAGLYKESARMTYKLAERITGFEGVKNVVDLGCGTFNPGYYWAKANPYLNITGIDLNFDPLLVAQFKLGNIPEDEWHTKTSGIDTPLAVQHKLNSMRSNKTDNAGVVEGRTEEMPFPPHHFDMAYGVQFIHWTDIPATLKEINRILKPGSLVFLDTSGLQYVWGNGVNQTDINILNPANHPFHKAFLEELNREFDKRNLPQIDPEKIDQMHRLIDSQKMRDMCINVGLKPVQISQETYLETVKSVASDLHEELTPIIGDDFNGVSKSLSPQEFADYILKGGIMRYFNDPLRRNVKESERNKLIERAYQAAIHEHADLLNQPATESLVFFVLQKLE